MPIKYAKIDIKTGEIIEIIECAANNPIVQNADKIIQVQYTNYVIVKYSNIENKTPQEIKGYAFSLRPKIICQLDKDNNLINRWINSTDVLSSDLHVSKSCLFDCLHGRRKSHLGYKWQYYKDWKEGEVLSDSQEL